MKRCFFLAFYLAAFPAFLNAQDLTPDTAFFRKQAKLYQRWLDHSGLGKMLRVKGEEVQPHQVALYLAFPTENFDTVSAIWERLKIDFDALGRRSLEEELFYKMVQLFELKPTEAYLRLNDSYPGKTFVFPVL